MVVVGLTRSSQLGTQVGDLRLYLEIGCSGEEGRGGFQSLTWVGKSGRRARDSAGLSKRQDPQPALIWV